MQSSKLKLPTKMEKVFAMTPSALTFIRLNLYPRLKNQHAIMGLGDFAHDIGEAGVALRGANLEGVY